MASHGLWAKGVQAVGRCGLTIWCIPRRIHTINHHVSPPSRGTVLAREPPLIYHSIIQRGVQRNSVEAGIPWDLTSVLTKYLLSSGSWIFQRIYYAFLDIISLVFCDTWLTSKRSYGCIKLTCIQRLPSIIIGLSDLGCTQLHRSQGQ